MPNKNAKTVHPQGAIAEHANRHAIAARIGGGKFVDAVCARVAACPTVETHADDDAVPAACASVALAIRDVERTIQEHADAQRSEVALNRARLLLIEAAGLLECVNDVQYHRAAIRAVREAGLVADAEPV